MTTLPATTRDNTANPRVTERCGELDGAKVSGRFLELIPRDFAREHLIVSQGEDGGAEYLAVAATTDACAIFNTGVRLVRRAECMIAEDESIARVIDEAYGRGTSANGQMGEPEPDHATNEQELDRLIAEADKDLLNTSGKGPVVKLVDAILFDALGRGASDVHIQPLPAATLVRYRLDGVLHNVRELSLGVTTPVVSRIKVMGRMDIAERRVPQDGRASVKIGSGANGRAIDLRISTLPTSYGERTVIRLLDNTRQLCELAQIGMPDDIQERYLERAAQTSGIILVTGPTGSGKTTTLYSTLRRIGSTATNIMTIEDPIEYELSSLNGGVDSGGAGGSGGSGGGSGSGSGGGGLAVSQSQVNARKGVTFATGLRHILRQDPDIVMIGEIRDLETARIAIQSSLTGHLVFSTLHTNDAASAITRLIDLGIEPYLVSASLSSVLAQRLVRTIHISCNGRGCDECLGTGFHGRTGVYELMTINDIIRELISAHASLTEIRKAAQENGMRSLAEEGARLVQQGITTSDEVRRVVEGAA